MYKVYDVPNVLCFPIKNDMTATADEHNNKALMTMAIICHVFRLVSGECFCF